MHRTNGSARSTVFVVELTAQTGADLRALVEQTGAQVIATTYPIPHELRRRATIVVAAMSPGSAPATLDLTALRAMRAAELIVVAVCEGCGQWRLAQRCEPLLAGAVTLLDSSRSDFGRDLQAIVATQLELEQARELEHRSATELGRRLGIIGSSPALKEVLAATVRFAKLSDVPVLLDGETGTGKELLARALHRLDPKRCDKPFVAINCAAINRELAESELFGYRRGAFTGADRNRPGLFRAADGGVIFLDEIGELDLDVQAKLLRVLQENRVLSLGADHEERVDVRVIAATNRDLRRYVADQRFRSDLFYRLSALTIHVPALHERPEDIGDLVAHFLEKHGHLHAGAVTTTEEFVDVLRLVRLDGNVRQLENIIRELLVQKQNTATFRLSDLPLELLHTLLDAGSGMPAMVSEPQATEPLVPFFESQGWTLDVCMDICERTLLNAALMRSHGNQTEAARMLGVTPRTIYNKLRKHGITV